MDIQTKKRKEKYLQDRNNVIVLFCLMIKKNSNNQHVGEMLKVLLRYSRECLEDKSNWLELRRGRNKLRKKKKRKANEQVKIITKKKGNKYN